MVIIPAWYSVGQGFWSGTGNRLSCETCVFSVFLTNAVSTSDYSATDSFHTFSNSLFASDLIVSEITQLVQRLVCRMDDRETEFRSPIRELNFFLSVAPRSALGYNHTLVQCLSGSFIPFGVEKIHHQSSRLWMRGTIISNPPHSFHGAVIIKHMLITLSLGTLYSHN
jgi:hypothetical protein